MLSILTHNSSLIIVKRTMTFPVFLIGNQSLASRSSNSEMSFTGCSPALSGKLALNAFTSSIRTVLLDFATCESSVVLSVFSSSLSALSPELAWATRWTESFALIGECGLSLFW